MAKADTYKSYQQAPVIKDSEQLQDFGDKNMVCTGVGNPDLFGISIK